MSSHLVGPWLSTTRIRRRKIKITKRKQLELDEYNQERKSKGLESISSFIVPKPNKNLNTMTKIPSLQIPEGRSTSHIKSLDPTNMSPCPVTSIMDPKTLAKESKETREAIIAKSKRIAPAYNKGAAQFISDGMDPTDIGRKK